MKPIDNILFRLKNLKRQGKGWMAQCPAHDDRTNSLKIDIGADYRVLLKCHANCTNQAIVEALGLHMSDLFLQVEGASGMNEPKAIYHYRDEGRNVLFEVCRYEPKTFKQRRPDGKGGYIWNLEGVRRVPYLLPELLEADPLEPVFIPEGEKDVVRLTRGGCIATTNQGGAGKWRDEYNTFLRGRKVVLLPDNDAPGQEHVDRIARGLVGYAASVKVLRLPHLPEKGDVSDWLANGGSVATLRQLAQSTREYSVQQKSGGIIRDFDWAPIGDVLMEPEEPLTWLVDDLLPAGGVSLLAARAKTGKSVLARNLALAIARGERFLRRPCAQGTVLYLGLEERREDVRSDFAKLGVRNDDAIIVHVGSAPEKPLEALRAKILETDAKLVIIDPLVRFARMKEIRSYTEVYEHLGPLNDMANELGCHICCLLHMNQMSNEQFGANGASDVIGGEGLIAVAFTIMQYYRDYTNDQRFLRTIQRKGADMAPTLIEMEPDTLRIHDAGLRDAVQFAHAMRSILDYIRDAGGGKTEGEIKDGSGVDTAKVSKAIRTLIDDGYLIRSGAGKKGNPYTYDTPENHQKPPKTNTNQENGETQQNQENQENHQSA